MIERANVERLDIGFILIDGDHSREGVGSDIGAVLKYVPVSSTVVLMHDSFNPECRRGIAEAPWQQSLHVHAVDLDLVPGVYWNPPVHGSSLWGGLGIAILRNHKRTQCLQMSAAYAPLFEQCRSACGDRV